MRGFMKKTMIRMAVTVVFAVLMLAAFSAQAGAYDWVRPKSISVVGTKKITMTVGQEKKLRVRMKPLHADDDFLRWKIVSGKNYVRFDDADRSDDSMDIVAKKAGTAKIQCYINGKSSQKVTFTVKVKKASKKAATIVAKGSKTKYVEMYDDFDLEVRKTGSVSSRNLKWSIADKKIVAFENKYETKGTEVELFAKKAGTTTVTCTNTATKGKVTFTVKVVKRYDDYDDYDDFWDDFDD